MGQAIPAVMAISTIISTAVAGYTAVKQYGAAEDAERIAEQNAEMKRLETEEEARRLEKNQEREVSRARARAMASGIDPESKSYQLLIEDITTTHKEELDWLKKSGFSQAEILEEQGEYASAQAKTAAYGTVSNIFGSVPTAYERGQTAGWWR